MNIFKMLRRTDLSEFDLDNVGTDNLYNSTAYGETRYINRYDRECGQLMGLYESYGRMCDRVNKVLLHLCYTLLALSGVGMVFDFMRIPVVGYSCLGLLALIMIGMICQFLVGSNKGRVYRRMVDYRYIGNIISGARDHYLYERSLDKYGQLISKSNKKVNKVVNHFPEDLFEL